MSAEKRIRRLPAIAIVVLGLLLGFVLLIAANRKNVKAGLHTPIRFDDFEFQVEDILITPGTSNERLIYTVTLNVENRAKRVPFTYDEMRFVVRDSAENVFHTIPPATIPSIVAAGSNATFVLRFDLPAETRAPRMRVLANGPLGDVLEFLFFGDQQFMLPEP